MAYKPFLVFLIAFLLTSPISSKEVKGDESYKPFRPSDSIPDKKDFTIAKDGRAVRKGTFKSFIDNIFLLDALIQLPESESRKNKISACTGALKEISEDLYSIGIFDRVFTIKEWLQNHQKVGRIIATLACAQVFMHKLPEKDMVLFIKQLHKMKSDLKITEVQDLIDEILRELER